MEIFYSSKEKFRKDYMFILALGFIGIGALAYFAVIGLSSLLRAVDGAAVILKALFWLLAFSEVFLFAYLVLNGSRNELVFGISEEGKLYRLPSRKDIMRDPQFYEVNYELQERMDRDKRVPGLPRNSQEILETLRVEKKDAYYLIECRAMVGGLRKKQSYALHFYFNDMDRLIDAFRKLM